MGLVVVVPVAQAAIKKKQLNIIPPTTFLKSEIFIYTAPGWIYLKLRSIGVILKMDCRHY